MIKWSGYEWLTQERWGKVHKDKPYAYYDEKAVKIDEENKLHLYTHFNPMYLPEIDDISKFGVGLVSCTTKFTYGTFEIEAKLPRGNDLWPAFWLWSFDSWPPEIDVFEGVSSLKKSSYFKFNILKPFGFWNLKPNIHYDFDSNRKTCSNGNHFFSFRDPSKTFFKYKLEWFPDRITIYYNNIKIQNTTNKDILKFFKNTTMNVIINNHIRNDAEFLFTSDFVVKYFKYIKY